MIPADACRYVTYQTYTLKAGETLTQPVGYVQKPIVRTVGQPLPLDKILDPITRNPNLQLHAFDQVRFEKPIPLQTLMAYPEKGEPVELTADRPFLFALRDTGTGAILFLGRVVDPAPAA